MRKIHEAALPIHPIGYVQSCFPEKFGIPRQPGLVPGAVGTLVLKDEEPLRRAIEGLENFSHVWVIFLFSAHGSGFSGGTVRPPRLGGKRMGVLATRAPHRPNNIGLSVLEILSIDRDNPKGPSIEVAGVDILDGSPILDIKPYLPWADAIPQAQSRWAPDEPEKVLVACAPGVQEKALRLFPKRPQLLRVAQSLAENDIRPAHLRGEPEERVWKFRLWEADISVTYGPRGALIISVEEVGCEA